MDVSKEGWGRHLARRRGDHTAVDAIGQTLHPELLAVWLTIKHFLPQLHGAAVDVLSDNSTTVAYINKEGRLSHPLCANWPYSCGNGADSIKYSQWLWTLRDPGTSQRMPCLGEHTTDWSHHKVVVRAMFEHWPVPCVDPFASERNHKLLVFFSMCPSRTLSGINALTQNLVHLYWYVCPPKNLTPRVLRKLRLQPTAHISYWWVHSGPASCGSAS